MEKSRAIELLEHLAWDRDIERNPYGDALNMAIEALKAQLSCEGTIISRQWLLECVDEGWIKFDTEEDANRFIHLVRDIAPGVRSVATDTNVGDTISRQAAIDALIGVSGSKSIEELTEECEVYQSDNRCWSGGVYGAIRAIKALPPIQPEKEQLSCEGTTSDLISRQAAIDAVDKYDFNIPEYMEGFVTKLRDAMKEDLREDIAGLPPAQPEPQWIPVSERLPEEDTEVLISYRYKEGEGDTDHVNIDITSYGTTCFGGREIHTLKEWRQPFDYFHANYEVIAWMPLPTPYTK